jgi:hypothetical protein
MGGKLWTGGATVLESGKSAGDIVGHGDVNIIFVVVPFNNETAVVLSGPVNRNLVVGTQGIEQMIGIRLREIFDAKIVNA